MNSTIIIRDNNGSKYEVFDGDLLLACFSSETAAQEFAKISAKTYERLQSNRENSNRP